MQMKFIKLYYIIAASFWENILWFNEYKFLIYGRHYSRVALFGMVATSHMELLSTENILWVKIHTRFWGLSVKKSKISQWCFYITINIIKLKIILDSAVVNAGNVVHKKRQNPVLEDIKF